MRIFVVPAFGLPPDIEDAVVRYLEMDSVGPDAPASRAAEDAALIASRDANRDARDGLVTALHAYAEAASPAHAPRRLQPRRPRGLPGAMTRPGYVAGADGRARVRRAVFGIAAVIVVGVALWLLWPRVEAPPAPPPPPVPVATREAPPPPPPPRPVAPPRPTVFPQPNGEVLVERRVEDAAVYGRVRGAERLPDGAVFIEGCGVRAQQTPVDEDGTFFASVKVGRCDLRAWRAHGALKIPGPWVSIDPQPGAEMDVDLSVPTFEPAGMGVRFEPVEGGVRISSVVAGSPAEGAGIEPGDLVTRVDGVPTDGMDVDTFLQHGLGPVGSPVEIQGVKPNGEAFRAVMNREKVSD